NAWNASSIRSHALTMRIKGGCAGLACIALECPVQMHRSHRRGSGHQSSQFIVEMAAEPTDLLVAPPIARAFHVTVRPKTGHNRRRNAMRVNKSLGQPTAIKVNELAKSLGVSSKDVGLRCQAEGFCGITNH